MLVDIEVCVGVILTLLRLIVQGLEVIEAHYLFGAEYDDIEIVIHPQSIIHSMVETQVGVCRRYKNAW